MADLSVLQLGGSSFPMCNRGKNKERKMQSSMVKDLNDWKYAALQDQ